MRLTKAQIELARDWNAAHYHPEHKHARTCDKALAAYERVAALLADGERAAWAGRNWVTLDELRRALEG